MVPRRLAFSLTLGVSLRLLPVPLLPPAEDRQGDEEQPDHHQEEAAQQDEEGGLQLLVGLELRPLTAGREVIILFYQDLYYQSIRGHPLPLAPAIKALVFHSHLQVGLLVWHLNIDLSRARSFEG